MNNRRKLRFIINPKSGIGRQKKIERLICKYFDNSSYEYEICYTDAPGHATALSKEAAEKNYDAVIAVGGDGSVNEVARGIVFTNTALGIVPAGSGNGLAHFLGISLNPKKSLKKIVAFHTRTIDTGVINGHLFVSIAGLGFDAYVAERFSNSVKRGFWPYLRIAVLEYIFFKPNRYKVYVNGQVFKKRLFLLSFANSNQFGFNAKIGPTAKIDDGLIDLCLLKKPHVWYAVLLVPFLFLGLLHKTPFLKVIQTNHVRVIQHKNAIAHIDGDEIFLGRSIEVSVQSKSLKVIV